VDDYLRGFGVTGRRTLSDDGGKANLFATLGPAAPGGVVLSGHTDVVPVEGQPWTSEPFTLSRRGARLFGRGTADMKSFLAVALALVPEALEAGLKRPIHLALSYDEEIGCFGVGRMIDDVVRNLPMPAAVVIGEPTDMRLVSAHKGGYGFETEVTGKEAHSSQPHLGASAILAAAELIGFLAETAEDLRRSAPADCPFEPPHSTISVGTVAGGAALNIIARRCVFGWDLRTIPGDRAEEVLERFNRYAEEEVLPRLRATAPEAAIVTRTTSWVPALAPEDDGPAEALIRLLTGANRTHVVSYCTEGGLFQEAGLSTVVCGPGSIDQAHRPDEFIEIAQIEACEAFVRKLIAWAAGDGPA
ncbi:MAG: acetylornithine deacetylase, partial [Kiloniellales bacterium]